MVEYKREKGLTPPYVPYKTLETYLEELKQSGLPAHIDRSTMPTKSGGTQGQLIAALKSLQLIGRTEGKIAPSLERLVYAEGAELQQVWKEVIEKTYPYLFSTDDFDLSTTTELRLRKKFEEQGVTGSTLRRCLVFFIQASNRAGVELSSFVKDIAKRKSSSSGKSRQKKNRQSSNEQSAAPVKVEPNNPDDSDDKLSITSPNHATIKEKMMEKMTDKFPAYDPNWDSDVQAKWFEAFSAFNKQIMDLDKDKK